MSASVTDFPLSPVLRAHDAKMALQREQPLLAAVLRAEAIADQRIDCDQNAFAKLVEIRDLLRDAWEAAHGGDAFFNQLYPLRSGETNTDKWRRLLGDAPASGGMAEAVREAIAGKLLEPTVIIDDLGRDVRGWRFTKAAMERFAPVVDHTIEPAPCSHCGAVTAEEVATRCVGEAIGIACDGRVP